MSPSQIEYVPEPGFELAQITAQLPRSLHAGREDAQSGRRDFYDTFDRRLRSKGLVLMHEDGFLKLRGADGQELAALQLASAPDALWPSELAPGPLREQVAAACDVRVLIRGGQIEIASRTLSVLDDEDKTVVRVVLERAELTNGGHAGEPLRPRLHLVPVRGYDKELQRVRAVLEDELGAIAATESLADEVHHRTGPAPVAPAKLVSELPADRAAVALSIPLLEVVEANMAGTLADLDSEFLHDLRVAVRRTRSLQRELKDVFPPAELARFRAEFKWLQQVTGPTRDLDVYLLEFEDFSAAVPEGVRHDLGLLRGLLEEHLVHERTQMEAALRSERTRTLLSDWAAFLDGLPTRPVDDRPHAVMPIGELAARRISRVYRQMVKMGGRIDDSSPAGDLHDLRKKGKELRYLFEFFAPLFPAKGIRPIVKTLKALQDTLGRFQDREVQATMIRGLGAELSERPGGAATLMAIGVLAERLDEQQDAARREFSERFAALAAPERRELVKRVFG